MVLNRFLSPMEVAPRFLDMDEVKGFERGVVRVRMVLGVEGTFLTPVGLVVVCRVVEGWRVVRRADVVDVRSEERLGANDILLGLADIPSLLFSSPDGFSSTELADCLF